MERRMGRRRPRMDQRGVPGVGGVQGPLGRDQDAGVDPVIAPEEVRDEDILEVAIKEEEERITNAIPTIADTEPPPTDTGQDDAGD